MGALDAGGGPEPKKGKKSVGLKKRGRPGITLDMTPMVDIAFLLLIFFMCTTRFREPQAIEITLPPDVEEGVQKNVPQSNVMMLNIMPTDTILQNMAVDPPKAVAPDSLDSLLTRAKRENIKKQPAHQDARTMVIYESGADFQKKFEALPADIPKEVRDSFEMVRDEKICRFTVLINVNRDSRYDKVVAVMDAVQQNQIARFAIIEQKPEDMKAVDEAYKKGVPIKPAAPPKGGK